jgi:hypothetical protein
VNPLLVAAVESKDSEQRFNRLVQSTMRTLLQMFHRTWAWTTIDSCRVLLLLLMLSTELEVAEVIWSRGLSLERKNSFR